MNSQDSPRPNQPVAYKGEPLDAARGPGLGCFWVQMLLLLVLLVITPLSATNWGWPIWATSVLFIVMILLLLVSGQTMIFLLRIVAAGRSDGRRRPLASPTPTVGEIEDEAPAEGAAESPAESAAEAPVESAAEAPDAEPATRAPDPESADPEPATPAESADPPAAPGSDVPGMRQ